MKHVLSSAEKSIIAMFALKYEDPYQVIDYWFKYQNTERQKIPVLNIDEVWVYSDQHPDLADSFDPNADDVDGTSRAYNCNTMHREQRVRVPIVENRYRSEHQSFSHNGSRKFYCDSQEMMQDVEPVVLVPAPDEGGWCAVEPADGIIRGLQPP